MKIEQKITQARKRQEMLLKRIGAGIAVVGMATVLMGFSGGEEETIEEVYTVKPGDTLFSIAEEYLPKNTAGRKYLLQFQQEIITDNPALQSAGSGSIEPGQKLTIRYQAKSEHKKRPLTIAFVNGPREYCYSTSDK